MSGEARRPVASPRAMSRKPAKPASPPSREQVIAYLAGDSSPSGVKPSARVTKREIARAFRLRGEGKGELKTLLRTLESEGAVKRGRKVLSAQGRLPGMVVADIVERGPDGAFVATPAEGESARILIRPSKGKRDRGPAPTLGARVLVRVAFDEKSGAYSGRVVKILDKSAGRPLGVYHALESGGGRVQPIEKRAAGRDLFVPAGMEGGARDGELVALEPLREGGFGLPSARVVERLGPVDTERAISLIAIAAHGLPDVFSEAALAEAAAARPATMAHREDWRELPLVTIDPPDAKDHDDAVHAEADAADNPGGFVVTVAIADVAHYVRARLGARPRGAGARQFGLFPRPRRADAARAHLQRSLLAAPARGPAGARGADGHRRRRPQDAATASTAS